jgi:SagB-type dehydrogenase family enzyme
MYTWLTRYYGHIIELDRKTWIKKNHIERGVAYRVEPMPPFYKGSSNKISLPPPKMPRGADASKVLLNRRSIRDFADKPLDMEILSSLLHLAFGVTRWERGVYGYKLYPLRSFPSAGALYPVEIYVSVHMVRGMPQGLYRYIFLDHSLDPLREGYYGELLAKIALDQEHVASSAITVIITVLWARSAWKYGSRGYKYALLDAGFAGENLYIASGILGLGTCAVGAFYEEELCDVLGIDCVSEIPVLMMPVGYPLEIHGQN